MMTMTTTTAVLLIDSLMNIFCILIHNQIFLSTALKNLVSHLDLLANKVSLWYTYKSKQSSNKIQSHAYMHGSIIGKNVKSPQEKNEMDKSRMNSIGSLVSGGHLTDYWGGGQNFNYQENIETDNWFK